MYPKLVPYLEKNRKRHLTRSKVIRQLQRQRRLRMLLHAMKHRESLLEVDRNIVTGEGSISSNGLGNDSPGDETASDDDAVSSTHLHPWVERKVVLRAPFPSMVDALDLPILSELLETDTDADTMEESFEQSRDEIDAVLASWGSTVEHELVDILKEGASDENSTRDSGSEQEDAAVAPDPETPTLDLGFGAPAADGIFKHLLPDQRLLLRADSVFRIVDDNASPHPLYYPELFSILEARTRGYFEKEDDDWGEIGPKLGYSWKTSDLAYYEEGVVVAKALLNELGKPDVAQFALQALGRRFLCGRCPDKRPKTWNEMVSDLLPVQFSFIDFPQVHHYAAGLVHARSAEQCTLSAKDSIVYNHIHALGSDVQAKRKHKPLIIMQTLEESEVLPSGHVDNPTVVECNLCAQLDISFMCPRDIMLKHVRAV
jgi:hypothetical protein